MDLSKKTKIVELIKNGAVGVMPTDTIYGIVASALDQAAVERIYRETNRPLHKAFITLVSELEQLTILNISLTPAQAQTLSGVWPGPVSAILSTQNEQLEYLHRGLQSLAVRLPDATWLRELVNETGPIVATSANLSGVPTPSTLGEVKKQLPNLDFYADGPVGDTPSRLARVYDDGTLEWLERQR